MRRQLLLFAACIGAACTSVPPPGSVTEVERVVDLCAGSGGAATDEVALTYLGSGGVLLRAGDDALLTAPFYTNPGVLRVGLAIPLWPDQERIDALLPDRETLDRVRGVLVGHAHYDHALDLPVVMERTPHAAVYGSATLSHILAPVLPPDRRVVWNAVAADADRPGEWQAIPGSPFHVLPIVSDHGPQIGSSITLFHGRLEADQKQLPRTAYGWKDGQTFAFLVDVRRADGSVAFRMHYQDAASHPPLGIPMRVDLELEHRVDVAVVCVGGFAGTPDYPQAAIRSMRPRHAVLGHWEDFFRDPRKPLRVVRSTSLPDFLERLASALPADADWTLPDRNVTIRFRVCPSTSSRSGADRPGQ